MKKFLKTLLLINTLITIATISTTKLNAVETVEPVKVNNQTKEISQTISNLENSKQETHENFENNKNAISPEIIWKNVNSMKAANNSDTTDGIFVSYEESGELFYDLLVAFTADLAPKNGASSVLNQIGNKDLKVRIVDLKNNKEIATKTAKHYLSDNGKHNFDFKIKHSELNEKDEGERDEPYKLEVYDEEKLIGTFTEHLCLVKDRTHDESLKIQTTDGTKTTDTITVFSDDNGNLNIMLHPRLHSFQKIKQDKPSVFKGQNPIKVDFVDEKGNVVMSKNTKQENSGESNPDYNSKKLIIDKSEMGQIDVSKSYTLKFYDNEKLLGTKFLDQLNKHRY